jgi:phosphatidylinositol-3-phosphatase
MEAQEVGVRARRSTSERLARLFLGGTEGNERLTATSGAVLLALLAIEGATILSIRSLLTLHIFVGMLLIPPVLLKLAATGYRFGRYYTGHLPYRTKGPPRLLLRILVAPFLVASTVALFTTGIALLVAGPGGGLILGLHKASFVVWLSAMTVHVLAYALQLPQLVRADWGGAKRTPGTLLRHGLVALSLIAGLTLALAALSLAAPWTNANKKPSSATDPLSGGPCGTRAKPPVRYRHVVWIVMENKGFSDIIGSSAAPYINSVAKKCGVATNFNAESSPSLPNYVAMTSGGTQGISDDDNPSSHHLAVPSIFSQLRGNWRALAESMPSHCRLSDSGLYAVRHNPAAYYTNIRQRCASRDVRLTYPLNLSAKFTFVTPNICDDMHSCPNAPDPQTTKQVRNGDTWLSSFLPKVLTSPQYQSGSTAVFLTWDEDGHIPTIIIAPSTRPGSTSSATFTHYSLLRTTEQMLGIRTYLGRAASAVSMRSAFHI